MLATALPPPPTAAGLDDPRARALLARWTETTRDGRALGWSLLARAGGRRVSLRRGLDCRFSAFAAAVAQVMTTEWDTLHLDVDVERHRVIRRAVDLPLLPHDEALGMLSVRMRLGTLAKGWSPSTMIARNHGFALCIAAGFKSLDIPSELFWRLGGTIETFRSRCFVLPAGAREAIEVERGHVSRMGRPVDLAEVRLMAQGLHGWLLRNTAASGKTTYRVNGADGSLPTRNNAIRQFMATIVLGRAARRMGGAAAAEAARRSLAFNLSVFYRQEDGIGMIVYRDQAKLGAAALAALAILEQEGPDGLHGAELHALTAGIERLWQPDGAFRTFHIPTARNDNQNFYPGEALLFLAELNALRPDPRRRARILASIGWYRTWHRTEPNPAFVPWHTKAAIAMHRQTGDEELVRHVFEMNDWVLGMQQYGTSFPDLEGRFYRPDRPDYGPPHAASTSVLLEGLLAAAALARDVGDDVRLARYRQAVADGLRSLRELQYRDHLDLSLVSPPERFAGGLRTNPFCSDIRVDNVQHALEAVLQALDAPTLALDPGLEDAA